MTEHFHTILSIAGMFYASKWLGISFKYNVFGVGE